MTSMDNSSFTLTLMLSSGGAGVPDSVADSFADNRFGMIGQPGIDDRKRADTLHSGTQLVTRKLGHGLVQPLAQPGGA
jgi:hypothetical protein